MHEASPSSKNLKKGAKIGAKPIKYKSLARLPKHALRLVFTLILMDAICPKPALAYLDPGTGSMVLQMIIAGIAGAACTFKVWKQKLLNLTKKVKDDRK